MSGQTALKRVEQKPLRARRRSRQVPDVSQKLYEALRARGISPQAIASRSRELFPLLVVESRRDWWLVVSRNCEIVFWTTEAETALAKAESAPCGVFILEVRP